MNLARPLHATGHVAAGVPGIHRWLWCSASNMACGNLSMTSLLRAVRAIRAAVKAAIDVTIFVQELLEAGEEGRQADVLLTNQRYASDYVVEPSDVMLL